jgi:outer membrane autotransporter protein
MFWIVIAFIIVVGLPLKEAAAQQGSGECTENPIASFQCSAGVTQPVFTPSTAFTPSPLLRRTIEQLQQKAVKGEEIGGGASADPSNGPGLGFYANGLTKFTDIDPQRELGSHSDTFGATLGTDYGAERFVVGAALDYSHEDTNFKNTSGNSNTDEYGLQLTGILYPIGNLYLAGTTRFAYDDYDIKREGGAKGSPDGSKISVAGGPGYDFNLGNGFVVGLSGLIRWEWTRVDSYQESGAGAGNVNLNYSDDDIYMLTSILELNGQKSFSVPWGVLIPEVDFRYLHEFEDDPRTIEADVVGSTTDFVRYKTNSPDRNYYNVGAALTTVLPGGLALFVNYQAQLGYSDQEEQVVNFGVRTSFDYLAGLVGGASGAGD